MSQVFTSDVFSYEDIENYEEGFMFYGIVLKKELICRNIECCAIDYAGQRKYFTIGEKFDNALIDILGGTISFGRSEKIDLLAAKKAGEIDEETYLSFSCNGEEAEVEVEFRYTFELKEGSVKIDVS